MQKVQGTRRTSVFPREQVGVCKLTTLIKYLAYLLSRPSRHIVHTWRATSTELVTTFKPRIESRCKFITGLLLYSRGTLQTISFYCEVNNRLINHAKEAEGATVLDVLAISLFVFPRE